MHRFLEFQEAWESKYPAIIRVWTNAWPEMVPFLSFDREIRVLPSTTNAVESLNARLRRAANASGHFPTDQAALKRLYLAILSFDPTGKARQRWSNRWKGEHPPKQTQTPSGEEPRQVSGLRATAAQRERQRLSSPEK